jgi:hypothetical protein
VNGHKISIFTTFEVKYLNVNACQKERIFIFKELLAFWKNLLVFEQSFFIFPKHIWRTSKNQKSLFDGKGNKYLRKKNLVLFGIRTQEFWVLRKHTYQLSHSGWPNQTFIFQRLHCFPQMVTAMTMTPE